MAKAGLLHSEHWWLVVVELARLLNEVHLRRRLIHITNRWRLIDVPLRRRLIVDLRSLRNNVLHWQQVCVRKRWFRDAIVSHYRLP